jgi:uncharacterized membrane protein YtjA (UPF0391 family)
MLNWAITFFLLSTVSAIFSFAGTESNFVSLFGKIIAAGCLLLAVFLFSFHLRRHKHSATGRGLVGGKFFLGK